MPGTENLHAPHPPARRRRRRLSWAAFHVHLWLGVLSTVALLTIAITGVLLNHKRGLGLMADVQHQPTAALTEALPLERLARTALEAAPRNNREAAPRDDREAAPRADSATGNPDDDANLALIDRMDVRPRDGLVKVRLRDKASTEVTIDLATGKVLHVGARGDVFLEKLHSGEALGGQKFVLLSDIAAVGLVLMLITGYWLWLFPKWPHRAARADEEQT
ncbi:MAG: PepSY-associated TM helix domain-containing protein [Gemmatimonadaceae bacterium]|nr:PepSY-associated TM helix domain-containing protein [Gemmatimonadaceae bacterium]